ncbi:MAG: Uma2 family endonuclease [Saprospiraceae bacterium]|nr:Uma2 family endonuclease [Saprospiraceae bacterium]
MIDRRNLVDEIMEHSDAVLIVQQVQNMLRSEQERREEYYEIIGEDDKAEFVNGEIIYHSPVMKRHNDASKQLLKVLDVFASIQRLGYVGIEKILTKFTRNDYEPDICFFLNEKAKDFKPGQLIFPVPDFIVEVLSKSSRKAIEHDTVTKFEDYQKHGVGEYWIVDPDEETVEQYVLEDGKFRLVMKSGEGTIRSHVVRGFSIPIRAIFDEATNLAALREILK